MHFRASFLAALILATASAVTAQGSFVNFETPQTKPIAVATLTLGGNTADFILACNTPDNSLAIISSVAPYGILHRVPVGLGPCTVRFRRDPAAAHFGHAYVCNFDGDSVSVVYLELNANGSLSWALDATVKVGDEPSDIAFQSDGLWAYVSLSSSSSLVRVSLPWLTTIEDPPLLLRRLVSTDPRALKAPRAIAVRPGSTDDRIYALNFQSDDIVIENEGSGDVFTRPYDADLFTIDSARPAARLITGGMGSTHHSFALTPDGTRMYVVGTRAIHDPQVASNRGESVIATKPLGFVESHLWVVDCPLGGTPSVVPSAPRGVLPPPGPTRHSLSLNQDYAIVNDSQVAKTDVLSQPSDVEIITNTTGVTKLVITAFHSDKVAFLDWNNNALGGWSINRVSLPVSRPGYAITGPRGVAYSPNSTSISGPPGHVFVLNRLENSISIINATSFTVVNPVAIALPDPTPTFIHAGRKLLYSAALSGSRIVSCASCHVDGRTDALPWDLSGPADAAPIPAWIHDGHGVPIVGNKFPAPKGVMITQTLQGLVTFPVEGKLQDFATSAPYHWRGDRATLADFEGAFASLLGGALPGPAAMESFTHFVNSIMHPPNPTQPNDRVTPGTLSENVLALESGGSGALLGQQIFHSAPVPVLAMRACVDCHALPDGSNSLLTLEAFPPLFPELAGDIPRSPMATAEIRNVLQRESSINFGTQLGADFLPLELAQVGTAGLLHEGNGALGFRSLDHFIGLTFGSTMPGSSLTIRRAQAEAVINYVRNLDTGVSPAIGEVATWYPGSWSAATQSAANGFLTLLEAQADEANAGLVVWTRTVATNTLIGYFWDVLSRGYRREGTGTVVPRIILFAADIVVAQAVPVGTERRMSSVSGQATVLTGSAPSGITLEPMAPMSANTEIRSFFRGSFPALRAQNAGSLLPHTNIIYELTRDIENDGYGISSRMLANGLTYPARELAEPPRRLRVTGNNLRHGARLKFGVPMSAPPTTNRILGTMPIFPTQRFTEGEVRIWETTVELDVFWQLVMLNGGPASPNMDLQIRQNPMSTGLSFSPATWNRYYVEVVNEDGTTSGEVTPWPVLEAQYTR